MILGSLSGVAHSLPSDMRLFSVLVPVAFALVCEQALKLIILVVISVQTQPDIPIADSLMAH